MSPNVQIPVASFMLLYQLAVNQGSHIPYLVIAWVRETLKGFSILSHSSIHSPRIWVTEAIFEMVFIVYNQDASFMATIGQ